MKKLLALILAIASVFSLATFSASAETADENAIVIVKGNIEYVFEAGTSDDLINSFIESCENEHEGCEEAVTCGIICDIAGHNLESTTAYTITHKVASTDPRCLKKTYLVEACTRCNYSTQTLLRSTYVSCC